MCTHTHSTYLLLEVLVRDIMVQTVAKAGSNSICEACSYDNLAIQQVIAAVSRPCNAYLWFCVLKRTLFVKRTWIISAPLLPVFSTAC